MDPFFVSIASIAVGELGDKTQLPSLILATRLRKPIPIIAGIFRLCGNTGQPPHRLFSRRMGRHTDYPKFFAMGTWHFLSFRRGLGADP